jgi:VWFA-related protein
MACGLLVCGLLAGLEAGAQALAGQADAAVPVIRTETNLVLVDVVVDAKGAAVHGIDMKRFHLLEDGKERPLLSVDEHRPGDALGAGSAAQNSGPSPVLAEHVITNKPQYPSTAAVNVLLLDGLNTAVKDQARARQQMLDYLGTIAPGTPLAIFTLTSRLRLVQGFTTDPGALAAAMKSGKALPQPSIFSNGDLGSTPESASQGGSVAQPGLNIPGAGQLFTSDMAAMQTDMRVRTTMDSLRLLARYLDGIPGRKNLIWFSGSFPVSMDPEKVSSDSFRGAADYRDELRKTSVVMNAARVAVYPVDARGLMTLPTSDMAYRPSSGGSQGGQAMALAMARDNAAATSGLIAEHFAMEQLAADTGGRAFVNTGDFKGAVAEAVSHGSSYYTLAFAPVAKGDDGKFHSLKVKVDGGSFDLAYRHGYFTDDRDKANSPVQNGLMAEALLRGAPPATEIVFDARVLGVDDPLLRADTGVGGGPQGELAQKITGPTKRYVVDLRLTEGSLAFAADAQGVRRALVELAVVAYDGDGERVNYFDKGMTLRLNPELYAAMGKSGIPLRVLLDLPAGDMHLRVAVRDVSAAKVGSLEVPLRVVTGRLTAAAR